MKKILILVAMLCGCGGNACGIVDKYETVSARAPKFYAERGFETVGYQGWAAHSAGRCYWYTLRHEGKLWQSCLVDWNGELHEYALTNLEALPGGK